MKTTAPLLLCEAPLETGGKCLNPAINQTTALCRGHYKVNLAARKAGMPPRYRKIRAYGETNDEPPISITSPKVHQEFVEFLDMMATANGTSRYKMHRRILYEWWNELRPNDKAVEFLVKDGVRLEDIGKPKKKP